MTDAEFVAQIRRGLLLIMWAVVKRYGIPWLDLLPREVVALMPVYSLTVVTDVRVKQE